MLSSHRKLIVVDHRLVGPYLHFVIVDRRGKTEQRQSCGKELVVLLFYVEIVVVSLVLVQLWFHCSALL